MSTDRWRTLSAILGVVLVVILTLLAFTVLSSGAGSSPAPGASGPSGSVSASPSTAPPPTASASPSPTSSPSPSASPSSTPTLPPASIGFVGLKLDAQGDPSGQARTIAFTSDGPGAIDVHATSPVASGTAKVCLRAGTQTPVCKTGADLTFKGQATSAHGSWTVTAIGLGVDAPTIDLTIGFPAQTPAVKLTGFRFDGTLPTPDYNGCTVRLVARGDGTVALQGQWGGHPYDYELLAQDQTDAARTQDLKGQGVQVALNLPAIKGHAYRVTLQNLGGLGAGPVGLTASVAWP